jgi:Sap, sulfolipid-1-addressing protein
MPTIFLLALAAAVYPQLLAAVVVILTRSNPKPLLWACYLGSVVVSVSASIVILAIFRSRGSIAGTTSHRLGPATYVVAGAIALAVAIFVATPRGRELVGRDLVAFRTTPVARMRSKAEGALREGSLAVAAVVGAVLAIPGPFDLIALGRLASGNYGAVAVGAIIVAFTLIKFVLIEAPIVSYTIDPDGTAAKVDRFSNWMQGNKLAVVAAVVGLIGVGLITRGISGLG